MKGYLPQGSPFYLHCKGQLEMSLTSRYIPYRGLKRIEAKRPTLHRPVRKRPMSTDPRAQVGAYVAYGVDLYLVTDCTDCSIELENCKGVDSSTGHVFPRIHRHRGQVSMMRLVQAAPSVAIPEHLERQMSATPASVSA